MEKFIRSLPNVYGHFVRRVYSVIFSLQYKSIFAVANIDNKPAILISNEKARKVYFPKNLQYHFSSNSVHALLAYKDDYMWITEERTHHGETICHVGFDNPPNLTWHKFII